MKPNLKKQKEFFEKLNDLCLEYQVGHLAGERGEKAILMFDGSKDYYCFEFSSNWACGNGGEEYGKGLSCHRHVTVPMFHKIKED